MQLCIGTRGSPLALWQANWVKKSLEARHPNLAISLKIIKTKGDKILDVSLSKVGGKGLFIKEIEDSLVNNEVDLAVHSLKDMPGELPEGLMLGAIPARENPYDILITETGLSLNDLPKNAKIGTSSLRRKCQLLRLRPDLQLVDLRGNVDTRLKKLESGEFTGIVLAHAGVSRLGLKTLHHTLEIIPAVAQGALGLECRANDTSVRQLLAPLNDEKTSRCVNAERAFLKVMGGGCQVPLGCYVRYEGENVKIVAFVSSLDGRKMIARENLVPTVQATATAEKMANEILQSGGDEILRQCFASNNS